MARKSLIQLWLCAGFARLDGSETEWPKRKVCMERLRLPPPRVRHEALSYLLPACGIDEDAGREEVLFGDACQRRAACSLDTNGSEQIPYLALAKQVEKAEVNRQRNGRPQRHRDGLQQVQTGTHGRHGRDELQ